MNRTDPGLLEAVARVGSSLFGMLQNRLELASIEIGEARERLVFTIVMSFAALLLLGGAVVALSAWIAAALWPSLGPAVLGLIALVYGAAGGGLLWWLRSTLRSDPPLLADTLAELRTDAAMMRNEGSP
ncbi:MAG: phage holin family protein [Pseudomonadota bacterium]